MKNPNKKMTGKELLIEWESFCNNPKASGKKLHVKTGYISESGKITYEDTKEFNRALAIAKNEQEIQKRNIINKLEKNKSRNNNINFPIERKSSSVINNGYSQKRNINIRPRLRGKELLEYLDKNKFTDEISKKKLKKFMLETGYSIPFKKLTEKEIYYFYSAFLDAEDKFRNDEDNKRISKIGSKYIKTKIDNSVFNISKIDPPKANGKTFVYLIRDGKNGAIKIGMSNNVRKRMTSIINEYFVWPVELVFYFPFLNRGDAERMESALHRKYASCRSYAYATQSGQTSKEWFDLSQNQVNEITEILKNSNSEAKSKSTKTNFDSSNLVAIAFLIIPGILAAIALFPLTIFAFVFWVFSKFYWKWSK